MFEQGAKLYKIPPGCSDSACAIEVSPDEAKQLQASDGEGMVHVNNNGIFNDLDSAIKNAQQNSGTQAGATASSTGPSTDGTSPVDYSNKPTTQYIVFAPPASNPIAELAVAAYQNSGSPGGLTNAEQANVNIIIQTNSQGQDLDLSGHSRGSLTVDNAMNAAVNNGIFAPNVTVNYFGPAANVGSSTTTLQKLTDNSSATINSVSNPQDGVSAFVGGNPPTLPNNTGIPITVNNNDGSGPLANLFNVMFGTNTPHNCYGSSGSVGGCSTYWNFAPTSL